MFRMAMAMPIINRLNPIILLITGASKPPACGALYAPRYFLSIDNRRYRMGVKQLMQIKWDLQRRKRQLKEAESREEAAQHDIDWYQKKVAADRVLIGQFWFDLMISGISHRRYLQLVLEHDDGQ
jgi:hypothetical protein